MNNYDYTIGTLSLEGRMHIRLRYSLQRELYPGLSSREFYNLTINQISKEHSDEEIKNLKNMGPKSFDNYLGLKKEVEENNEHHINYASNTHIPENRMSTITIETLKEIIKDLPDDVVINISTTALYAVVGEALLKSKGVVIK